jgi:hypothetical protein
MRVAKANTAVGVSPESFLLLLLHLVWPLMHRVVNASSGDDEN